MGPPFPFESHGGCSLAHAHQRYKYRQRRVGTEWELEPGSQVNYWILHGFTEEMLTLPARCAGCCAGCLATGIHAAALVPVPRGRKVRVFAQDLLKHS